MKYSRKLGISSSLLLSLLGHDFPEQSLDTVSQAGIAAMEYFSLNQNGKFRDEAHLQRFLSATQVNDIQIWSVHAPFDACDISLLDEPLRQASVGNIIHAMDVANFFGAKTVVVHGSGEPVVDDERALRLEQMRRSLDVLVQSADERGVKLAVETLPRSCLGNRVEELLTLLDSVDGQIGVCFDVNHVSLYEKVKPALLAVGERLRTVHISDCDGEQERHWIPGVGNTDWQGFIEGLDELGYQGPLMHEAMNKELDLAGNVIEIAAAARKYLNWSN